MRKNKGLTIILSVFGVMALLLTLGLVGKNLFADPHAGHDHGDEDSHQTTTTATIGNNKPAAELFTYTEEKNGTYSYVIKGRNNKNIVEEHYLKYPVTITPIDRDTLAIAGQNSDAISSRWIYYCNIPRFHSTNRHFGVIAHSKKQVVRLDTATNMYRLFVYDAFDENSANPIDVVALEGVEVMSGKEPTIKKIENKNGKVTVTYLTDAGKEQSVSVNIE